MNHRTKGFTLIELLVVIAIIAILAAILFPVFAQAKQAAKKTQALSNSKQVDLGIQMYLSDSDDNFPPAFDAATWIGNDLWVQKIYPYVKNVNVFMSPADTLANQVSPVVNSQQPGNAAWAGLCISFAANGYYSTTWTTAFPLRGPMGIGNQSSWLLGSQNSASAMTQPADTILIAEKHSDDIVNGKFADDNPGNLSAYWIGGVIGGPDVDGAWPPANIPNGTISPTGKTYNYGPNGSVSAKYNNTANFGYIDGHAKALTPSATDPDPVNQPAKNQWDGMR